MKTQLIRPFIILLVLLIGVSGCRTTKIVHHPVPGHRTVRSMPPGHAKKVYGHQSARAFAPGQQKKYGHPHQAPGKGNKGQHGKGKGKK